VEDGNIVAFMEPKGEMDLRMPLETSLHRHAKATAAARGLSLKELVEQALLSYIGQPPAEIVEAVASGKSE
jgi:hypothetical protein